MSLKTTNILGGISIMNPVNKIDLKKFEGKHEFLSSSLLQPGVNHTDANRGVMFSLHLEQCTQLEQPQPPLMNTRFENQWSEYSSGYTKLKGVWKVIAKIKKNDYNYAMIVQKVKDSDEEKKDKKYDFEKGTYHVIFRKECEHLTEKYGYQYNNEVIDSLEKGDIVEDEVIIRDHNRDENMNFTYGRNLNVVYLSNGGLTTEDGLNISRSTAEAMAQPFVRKVLVSLNTNDILTNSYGTKKFYKAFPDIGEDCKNGLVCSVRRIQYQNAPSSLAILNKPFPGDQGFRGQGKVVDINIICNADNLDLLLDATFNKQIKTYYNMERNYYRNFVKFATPIMENKNNKVSKDFIYYFNRFKKLLDPYNKFKLDGSLFDNMVIEFTILEKHPLVEGSKITNRYGGKGVISKIYEDDEMPKLIDFAGLGEPDKESLVNFNIDVIANSLGVFNRLNPQQLLEMETNYCSKYVRYLMEQNWEDNTLEELKDYLLDYIKVVDKTEYKFMKKYLDNLDEEELENFLIEIIEKGIPVYQAPFYNNHNIRDLKDLYDFTEADRSRFENIESSLIFGEVYYMVLKHTPISKFSARSVDQLSIKNLPVKSNMYKQYKTDYSTTPIKIGRLLPM